MFLFLLLQSSYIAFDIINWSLQPLLPGWHPFCSAGSNLCSSKCVEILLVIIPVRVLYWTKQAFYIEYGFWCSWQFFMPSLITNIEALLNKYSKITNCLLYTFICNSGHMVCKDEVLIEGCNKSVWVLAIYFLQWWPGSVFILFVMKVTYWPEFFLT